MTSNRPRHVWNIGCMHVTFISKRTDAFITKYCCKLKGGLSGNSCLIMAKYFKWRLVRYAQSMCYFLDFIDQVIILYVFSISYHERCFQQLIHILIFGYQSHTLSVSYWSSLSISPHDKTCHMKFYLRPYIIVRSGLRPIGYVSAEGANIGCSTGN